MPDGLGDDGSPAGADSRASDFEHRFAIERELARGGMGRVVVARDLKIGRRVAIKMLADGPRDERALQRFEQEARAAGSLNHPNIVAVYDVGSLRGEPYIVTELLEGMSLRARIASGPIPPDECVALAEQLADGLSAAHEKGVVHRDLKPENLFVTEGGRLKILDFGIAKLLARQAQADGLESTTPADTTATGAILGTVAYMSPEQIRGGRVDHRSDIFGVGTVLHEMLSGAAPFRRGTPIETGAAILNDDPGPLPANVPARLVRIVRTCLEKDPAKRFPTARALLAELRGLSAQRAVARTVPFRWPRLAGAGLAIALALAGAFVWKRSRPPAAATSNDRIAIFPFMVRGNSQYGYLREGVPDVLATDLVGDGFKRVDRRALVTALRDSPQDLDPEAAAAIARRFDAGLFVSGEVLEVKDHLQLHAELFDVAAPRSPLAVATAEGEAGSLFAIAGTLASRLRPALVTRAGLSSKAAFAKAAQAATTSMPALRAFVEAEESLRRADWPAAMQGFQRAVAADPQFSLARYRLAWVAAAQYAWSAEWATARTALRDVVARRDQLPPRERRLVDAFDAYWHGRGGEAERLYGELVRDSPEDGESWFMLGETIYVNAPYQGRPAEEARSAYQHALDLLGSDFVPAAMRLMSLDVARLVGAQDPAPFLRDAPLLRKAMPSSRFLELASSRLRGDSAQWNRAMELGKDKLVVAAAASVAYALDEPDEEMALRDRWVEQARRIPPKPHIAGEDTPLNVALLNRMIAAYRLGRLKRAAADENDLREPGLVDLSSWFDATAALWPPRKEPPEKLRAIRAAQQPAEMLKNMIGDALQTRLQLHLLKGMVAALAGDAADAEEDAAALWAFTDEDGTRFPRDVALAIRAHVAWHSGDARAALALLEQRSDGLPIAYRYYSGGWAGDRYLRAQVLHQLGRDADALRWVDSILLDASHLSGEYGDGQYVPGSLLLRGRILEGMGDRAGAAVAYGRFVKQWAGCDPELRPILEDARARLAAVTAREPLTRAR